MRYDAEASQSWPVWRKELRALCLIALLVLTLFARSDTLSAKDWRKQYTTGKLFEICCGDKDCHTSASLGHPKIIARSDRGYDVQIKGYWLSYDFPAVHASQDDNTWICYLESNAEPDPLCLFLPPGTI